MGSPVSDKQSSLPVSWDPTSVTKKNHFRMTDDKASQVQSELSAGGTKRDVEDTPNVPAPTVSWPDDPV